MKTAALAMVVAVALMLAMALLARRRLPQILGADSSANLLVLHTPANLQLHGHIEAQSAEAIIASELAELDFLQSRCALLAEIDTKHKITLERLSRAGTVYGLTPEARARIFPDTVEVMENGMHDSSRKGKSVLPAGDYRTLGAYGDQGSASTSTMSMAGTISSVHVPLHCKGEAFYDTNFRGKSERLQPGYRDYYQLKANDAWRSLKVKCDTNIFLTKPEPSVDEPPPAAAATSPVTPGAPSPTAAPDAENEAVQRHLLARDASGALLPVDLNALLQELRTELQGLKVDLVAYDALRSSDLQDLDFATKAYGLTEEATKDIFAAHLTLYHNNFFEHLKRASVDANFKAPYEVRFTKYDKDTGKSTGEEYAAGYHNHNYIGSLKVPQLCRAALYTRKDMSGETQDLFPGNYSHFNLRKRRPQSAEVDCVVDGTVGLTFKPRAGAS